MRSLKDCVMNFAFWNPSKAPSKQNIEKIKQNLHIPGETQKVRTKQMQDQHAPVILAQIEVGTHRKLRL